MSDTKSQKDKILLLTQGSEHAFKELFWLYFPRLTNYANTFLNNRQEAEDLVQDVFIQIWNMREKIDPERPFSSYLFSLVKNRCLNSIKKKVVEDKYRISSARMASEELYHISFQMEDDFVSSEEKLLKELDGILGEMPDRCRTAFRLKWLDGKKIREIAEEMGISTTMVDKHLANGLRIARKTISRVVSALLF